MEGREGGDTVGLLFVGRDLSWPCGRPTPLADILPQEDKEVCRRRRVLKAHRPQKHPSLSLTYADKWSKAWCVVWSGWWFADGSGEEQVREGGESVEKKRNASQKMASRTHPQPTSIQPSILHHIYPPSQPSDHHLPFLIASLHRRMMP